MRYVLLLACAVVTVATILRGDADITDARRQCWPNSSLPLEHRQASGNPIGYFNEGFCGELVSADPRVWGPEAWVTLHRFSINYPAAPLAEVQRGCEGFLGGLPYMLPCSHCAAHLLRFIEDNRENAGATRATACRGLCTTLETACSSQDALVDFVERAHANVNAANQPCRRRWTAARIRESYGTATICTPSAVMGYFELARTASSVGEPYVVTADEVESGDLAWPTANPMWSQLTRWRAGI